MVLQPNFTWEETAVEVIIEIALRGASPANTDVEVSDVFVKVNKRPYLLALDLHAAVKHLECTTSFAEGIVTLRLLKAAPGTWSALRAKGNKAVLRTRREASVAKAATELQEAHKERLQKKHLNKRFVTNKQIDLDQKQRQRIINNQTTEKDAAEAELYASLETLEQQTAAKLRAETAAPSPEPEPPASAPVQKAPASILKQPAKPKTSEAEFLSRKKSSVLIEEMSSSSSEEEEEDDDDEEARLRQRHQEAAAEAKDEEYFRVAPHRRKGGVDSLKEKVGAEELGPEATAAQRELHRMANRTALVDLPVQASDTSAPKAGAPMRPTLKPATMTFTKSTKPKHLHHLPARTRPDEMARLEEQAKPRQLDTADLGEQNAIFMKDRGDTFFKRQDFSAAVNAYSAALTLDESLSAVYSNRAACHFMLSDHENCVADCDNALRLLETAILAAEKALREGSGERAPMDAAQRSKLRTLARRGSAHCLMQNHRLAAADYEAALLLDPQNMDLKADLVAVEAALQRERIVGLKAAADGLFRERSFEEAAARYTEALQADPKRVHVACLSNRAACQLMLGNDGECIKDCTAALEELVADAGGDKRTRMRLLIRRGTAMSRVGALATALLDYEAARRLGPTPEQLKALDEDIAALRAREADEQAALPDE